MISRHIIGFFLSCNVFNIDDQCFFSRNAPERRSGTFFLDIQHCLTVFFLTRYAQKQRSGSFLSRRKHCSWFQTFGGLGLTCDPWSSHEVQQFLVIRKFVFYFPFYFYWHHIPISYRLRYLTSNSLEFDLSLWPLETYYSLRSNGFLLLKMQYTYIISSHLL